MGCWVGIDVGTSGCRAVALAATGEPLAQAQTAMPPPRRHHGGSEQAPAVWWQALVATLDDLNRRLGHWTPRALALDATSGTVVLSTCAGGRPLHPALMYDDSRAHSQEGQIRAAGGHATALARALWLWEHIGPGHMDTQAGWLYARLAGEAVASDSNNVIKLGYAAARAQWPGWLERLGLSPEQLPQVVAPGTPVGVLEPALAQRWGWRAPVRLVAGTTDSTAAILATGIAEPGEAVTSLGSTLVCKVLAEEPVEAPACGVYSQPLGGRWLVGGGSNSGGAVLRHYFDDRQLARISREIDHRRESGLDYYPLLGPGERFPQADPNLAPRLTPRPANNRDFLHGLLEGIARIERAGYLRLAELGAPYPSHVLSVGGGANNPTWGALRARLLERPVTPAPHQDAAYGSALLARRGCP